jgi:DNA-binding NtrC family response regulator
MMDLLIVDDEVSIADILKETFMDEGMSVHALYSGKQAIQYLKNNQVRFILCDMLMPDGTGLELLDFLNSEKRSEKIFFMTGFSELSPEELVNKGAAGVFTKPVDLDALIKTFSHLLNP